MATVQDILNRATNFNPLNQSLYTGNTDEIISQVRQTQRSLYAMINDGNSGNRTYFATTQPWQSTGGASGRNIALVNMTPKVERILQIQVGMGPIGPGFPALQMNEIDVVNQGNQNAIAPRYMAIGQTLVEYASDWSTTSGPVTGQMTYCQQPMDLDPTGQLTQQISLPDDWNRILVYDLGAYLAEKDDQRNPSELEWFQQKYDETVKAFLAFCTHQSGVSSQQFNLAVPGSNKS